MALSYKARRRWSLFLLLVFMPAYIVLAVTIMTNLPRLPLVLEFIVYVILGIAWAIPFRFVFLGVGQADPDAPPEDED